MLPQLTPYLNCRYPRTRVPSLSTHNNYLVKKHYFPHLIKVNKQKWAQWHTYPTYQRNLHITEMCQSDKQQVLHMEYEDAKISKYLFCCGKKKIKDLRIKKNSKLSGRKKAYRWVIEMGWWGLFQKTYEGKQTQPQTFRGYFPV